MTRQFQSQKKPASVSSFAPVVRGFQQRPFSASPRSRDVPRSPGTGAYCSTKSRLGHDINRLRVDPTLPAGVRAKLWISQPGDEYEQEAVKVAEKVMRMPTPPVPSEQPVTSRTPPVRIRSFGSHCAEDLYPNILQKGKISRAKNGVRQTPEVGLGEKPYVDGLSSTGRLLPESTRAFFEPRFGEDFSQVRIHTDSEAARSARAINAMAYTVGQHIVFGEKQYAPHGREGRWLLAHELAHVVQQRAESINSVQRKPDVSINWWKPWTTTTTIVPGGITRYLNVEVWGKPFDSGWTRDAVGTGIIGATPGVAIGIMAHRLGLHAALAIAAGAGVDYAVAAKGLTVEERIWGDSTKVHAWYGRYMMNIFTDEILAVDFHGRGPSEVVINHFYYTQRLADAEGKTVFAFPSYKIEVGGMQQGFLLERLGRGNLPETSFGSWD